MESRAFPRGVGDGSLANWAEDAKWLIVKVDKRKSYVEFDDKCKFKKGEVVYCGSRQGATDYLYNKYGKTLPIIGGYCIVGDGETATAGYRGTATAGHYGTAIAGNKGRIQIEYYNNGRYRFANVYVGEDGIEPNVKYRCDEDGNFVKVKEEKND